MVQIYILWFLGIAFGITAIIEMAIVAYRLYFRRGIMKTHIILAVVFAVLSIGCMSSALLSVFDKAVSSDFSAHSVGQSVGKKTGSFSGAVYNGFKEELKNTMDEIKTDTSK